MMFKQYLQVTKPGIIFGNLISVIGGFLLASKGRIDYPLFIYTLVGVSLVVASGCVFNNYIDRDIDRKMERTKNRVLVKGLISPAVSLVYATLLGIAGFMLLWFGANPLACWLGRDWTESVLLAVPLVLCLLVELLNSAIENVVDRISLEWHPLAKKAKDMGSAAQFTAQLFLAAVWGGYLLGRLWA